MAKKPIAKKPMAKKPMVKKAAPKKAAKRRFEDGGVMTAKDILGRALAGSGDSGDLPMRGSKTATGRSGLPAVRSGRGVARPGGPRIDVDMQKRLSGMKDIGSGRGTPVNRPALPAPEAASTAAARGMGLGSRLLGGAGLMAYSPKVGEGSDKPQNYPGEGLKAPANQSIPTPRFQPDMSDLTPKPKAAPKAAPAAPKAAPRAARRSSDDDAFLADLRASAQRMRDTTAEAARDTGRMKGAMEEFQSAADDATTGFKRGGKVGGRGDGKAIRGRTKGRFI